MENNNSQTSMEVLSKKDRVFYFHGFIYFLEEDLGNLYDWKPEGVVDYFCHLLLIFDRILIPAEHISLSSSKQAEAFKLKFFNIPIIQNLIESGLIVTSIWSQTTDMQQHIEAFHRYARETGSNSSFSIRCLKSVSSIKNFQRDPGKQSKKAAEKFSFITDVYEWGKDVEKLSYVDGDVHIYISHEKLLLGSGKGIFDEAFIKEAKEAYISAMPTGNGRIYRSSVDLLETFENQIGLDMSDQDDFISPFCLTKKAINEVFMRRLAFPKLNTNHFYSHEWSTCYQRILFEREVVEFKRNLFNILHEVSMFFSGDLVSYFDNYITIYQKKLHNYRLIADGIYGLIELFLHRKFEDIIKFIGASVDELSKRKRYYLSPYVRDSMIRIWNNT